MYKIKIFPSINHENLHHFLKKLENDKLIGCPHELHNGKYNLIKNLSHKINDIFSIDEEMWALVEFLDNKNGLKMKTLVESMGQDKFCLKEFFTNKDNLGLNIYIFDAYRNLTI